MRIGKQMAQGIKHQQRLGLVLLMLRNLFKDLKNGNQYQKGLIALLNLEVVFYFEKTPKRDPNNEFLEWIVNQSDPKPTNFYDLEGLFGLHSFGNISSINVNETSCPIRYLEHVVVGVKIIHPRRGAIQISLNSPMGTESLLLGSRKKDYVSLTLCDLVLN